MGIKNESENKWLHKLAICLKMVNKPPSKLYAEHIITPYIPGKMLHSCNEYQKILTSKSRISVAMYSKTVTKWTWTSNYI